VLYGTCLDISGVSLYPLRRALRLLHSEPGQAGGAAELIMLLEDGMAGPDAAGIWLHQLTAGLIAVAGGEPLVLVIDDLQWIDGSTRDLLKHLLAVPVGMRLLVVGAARAEILVGDHPVRLLLSQWQRSSSVQVLKLRPLDKQETVQLATTRV
jgi:hypothetical protein